MNHKHRLFSIALACATAIPLQAGLIQNGGFELGLTGWSVADQTGSDGSFSVQNGTTSPVNGFVVPLPPEGSIAAMTDAEGPGSHLLFQDFVVPSVVPGAVVNFSLFIHNGADQFYTPAHLDFATPDLNQQARVDILNAAGTVLQNLYQTQIGDPIVSGYTAFNINVTALFQANAGQTLRLQFAEVDNVSFFNLGVDAVDINVSAIPEPSTWVLIASAVIALGVRRKATNGR